MTLTFHRTDERLLIKYIDDTFNIFSCVIPYHDKFVIDYCNSKLEKLEKLLQNYDLEEHDNKIILKVEEPICINYTLNKQTNIAGEQSGLILSKLKQLEKENKILKEKLEDIEPVYLDRYTVPINKGITTLFLNNYHYDIETENTILDLKPLEACRKLTKVNINLPYIEIIDLTPLKNLVELTIENSNNRIKSVLGLENCKKLSNLKFTKFIDSNVQKSIFENCTCLKELYITNCLDTIDFSKLQYTLEKLDIDNKHYIKSVLGLENCKKLSNLKFTNSNYYTNNPLNILENCTSLKELYITNFHHDKIDFSKLQYTLERLTIVYGVNINSAKKEICLYQSIENCKLLRYLQITQNENTILYNCKLDNLIKLEEIRLHGYIVITGLQTCINLKKINLSGAINLEDKNMECFGYLETIDLTNTKAEFKSGISNIRSRVQRIGC
jgi:hypothetical protein